MSQSTPASSQQPIDNGNTLIGTSNGGFGQPEFQPVSNNNMPAYPNDIQNFQMFQRMQQQQQQQQQQQMPTQQRFFQNGSAPNPIPQQILHQGKYCLHNHQMIAIGHLVTHKRIAILQLTQQQKNHERCNYKNLAHKLIMAMQHNYCVFQ